jgi:hypothetical protein
MRAASGEVGEAISRGKTAAFVGSGLVQQTVQIVARFAITI